MVKIEKNNVFLTVSEEELSYYKNQGYKKAGEKETVKKTVSLAKYNELTKEYGKLEKQITELNTRNNSTEAKLSNANERIAELETEVTELKNNGGK